mgnify:FL=1
MPTEINRRHFLTMLSSLSAGTAVAGSTLWSPILKGKKLKIALVGTGIRGITFWGRRLV